VTNKESEQGLGRTGFGPSRIWAKHYLDRAGFGPSRIWTKKDLGQTFGLSRIWTK